MSIDRRGPGPRTPGLLRALLIGAAVGLSLGLLALGLRALATPPEVTTLPTAPGPGGVASRSIVRVLDDPGVSSRPSVATGSSVDDPVAAAVRHAWTVRFLQEDYVGSLEIIERYLDGPERNRQLAELCRGLVPQEWLNDNRFPRPPAVRLLYERPGGPSLLLGRWKVASTVVDKLPDDADTVALLARMELLARILGAVHESPGLDAGLDPTLPALVESAEPGAEPTPSAVPAPAPAAKPLLIPRQEIHRLRERQTGIIDAIVADARRPRPLAWVARPLGTLGGSLQFLLTTTGATALLGLVGHVFTNKFLEELAKKVVASRRVQGVLDRIDEPAADAPDDEPAPPA